jgi:acetyltransferase
MEKVGLGYLLLDRLVAYARVRGLKELGGDVLRGNERMLKVVKELGFTVNYEAEQPDVYVTRLRLAAPTSASLPLPA